MDDILRAIGTTPTVRIRRLTRPVDATVFAKLEQFNPSGTIEDRAALPRIDRALRGGTLQKNNLVVEAMESDGGIALALACAARGISLVLATPEGLTAEKRMLLRSCCQKVVFTPASEGLGGATRKASELASTIQGARRLPPLSDVDVTSCGVSLAREIAAAGDAEGVMVDGFVVPLGANGVTAAAQALAERYPGVQCVAVGAPAEAGARDEAAYRVVTVPEREAWEARTRVAREEGILAGMSSGAVLAAALALARDLGAGKSVFAILADTGERYFSLSERFE
jgi:cysteine synthase